MIICLRNTVIVVWLFIAFNCTNKSESESPYLGLKPPGSTPELFAPNVVSTEKDEINAVFSPDFKTFYFSRDTYSNLSKAGRDYNIMFMQQNDSGWTNPNIVTFAEDFMNADMALAFNGKQLFYCSDRPLISGQPRKNDADIWMVDVLPSGWSKPKNPGKVINSNASEWYPCLTKNGDLYFSSSRKSGKGKSDLYVSRLINGVYKKAEPLKGKINTQFREGDVFISPDESYLIVVSSDRADTFGKGDLYISFRNENDEWSEAVNMGNKINSETHDYCPMLSPDSKYLFFTNSLRGNDDIYWVDIKIIDEFFNNIK